MGAGDVGCGAVFWVGGAGLALGSRLAGGAPASGGAAEVGAPAPGSTVTGIAPALGSELAGGWVGFGSGTGDGVGVGLGAAAGAGELAAAGAGEAELGVEGDCAAGEPGAWCGCAGDGAAERDWRDASGAGAAAVWAVRTGTTGKGAKTATGGGRRHSPCM